MARHCREPTGYGRSMSPTRRVQVLVDVAEEQYARLEGEAERRGGSVASVVREAIDLLVPPRGDLTATAAADLLLDAPPMPVDDWDVLKRELDEPVPDAP